MTTDGRRGVNITYNVLNLPETVVAGDQKVSYIYDAAGQKLASNANGSLTYYRSVMVYGNDNKLLYILHPEGTVNRAETSSGISYTYNYFKRDQIGSTRVMLSAIGGTLQVQQSTDYYPFGLSHENSNLHRNKYLFSGKELQDGQVGGQMLGLYDFGARPYDPTLGRWLKMDRFAMKYAAASPYNYCLNSPIVITDPTGDTTEMLPEVEVFGYNGPNLSLITAILSGLEGPKSPVSNDNSEPEAEGDNNPGGGGGNGPKGPSNYVEKASQNRKQSMKDKIGKNGFKFSKPFILTDPEDIKDFIWYNSFRNGQPYLENLGLGFKNGESFMHPNDKASPIRINAYLLIPDGKGGGYVNWEGSPRSVTVISHSHPTSSYMQGPSRADIKMMNNFPNIRFEIISNNNIYQVWSNGAYQQIGTVR